MRLWPSSSTAPQQYRARRDKYLTKLLSTLKDNIANGVDKPCITGNILKDPDAKLNEGEPTPAQLDKALSGSPTDSIVQLRSSQSA